MNRLYDEWGGYGPDYYFSPSYFRINALFSSQSIVLFIAPTPTENSFYQPPDGVMYLFV